MNKSIKVKRYTDHTDVEIWNSSNVIRVYHTGGLEVSITPGVNLSQNGAQTLIEAIQQAVKIEQGFHADWEENQSAEYLIGLGE